MIIAMEEATKTKARTKCELCGKTVAGAGGKSLTSWLFRQAECDCESKNRTSREHLKLVAETAGADQSVEEHSFKYQKGDVIGSYYQVLELIGFGGMGEVYRVVDLRTQSTFALKTISSRFADQKVLAKRLEHEADAARSLTHVNIAAVYDVSCESDGAPYLLMDYIDGQNLEMLLKTEVFLKGDRALNLFIQMAEALDHAHQKGIIHRDLKPSNILLRQTDTGDELVKLVDFGIAKVIDDATERTRLTRTGDMVGSPLYMSPEQCKGETLDGRSDIYALGCIMYEVVSGKTPFDAENPMQVILKHVADPAPKISKNVNIRPQLKTVIEKCLERDPDERYSSAGQLLADLIRVRDGKSLTPAHEWQYIKTLGLRFAAFVIDAFVVAAPTIAIFWAVSAALHVPYLFPSNHIDALLQEVLMSVTEPGAEAMSIAMRDYPRTVLSCMIVVTIIAHYLYFALQESGRHQATLGKRIMGLSVVDLAGNRLSFGRASARFWLKTLVCCSIQVPLLVLVGAFGLWSSVMVVFQSSPPLAFIFATILRKRYQMAHDWIAGCKVVPNRQIAADSAVLSTGDFPLKSWSANGRARWAVFLLTVCGIIFGIWALYTFQYSPSVTPTLGASKSAPAWLKGHMAANQAGGTEIDIPDMSLSDKQTDDIIRLQNVTKISASHCRLTPESLARLVRIPTLQEIDLTDSDLSDALVEKLSAATSLTRLNLQNSKINDEAFKYLAPLKGLYTIELYNTRFSGTGLHYLSQLEPGWVYVGGNRSEEFIEHLARSGIKNASLWDSRITDRGADFLAQSTTLKSIVLATPTCTDRTLAHLAASKSLTHIGLNSENVTDEGLKTLVQMKQIRRIHLMGCNNVSDQAIAKLGEFHPQADISR